MQGGKLVTLGRRCARLVRRKYRDPGRRAAEILFHRDLQARRAVQDARADCARERGLLLRVFELDQARDAARAAVVGHAEGVHRAVRLAHREHGFRQRIKIMRLRQALEYFRLHPFGDAIALTYLRLSQNR